MKLFFDENVSPKLCALLATEYPGSLHVEEVGLRGATDERIWKYCRENGFLLVTKDSDFQARSVAEGFPPKVIWLDVGNCGTEAIADLLRRRAGDVAAFHEQQKSSLLNLSP